MAQPMSSEILWHEINVSEEPSRPQEMLVSWEGCCLFTFKSPIFPSGRHFKKWFRSSREGTRKDFFPDMSVSETCFPGERMLPFAPPLPPPLLLALDQTCTRTPVNTPRPAGPERHGGPIHTATPRL